MVAAAVRPPRSPFTWLVVLLLVLVQLAAVPSAYAVQGTATGGNGGVVPAFRCTTDATWDYTGGPTASVVYNVVCKGTYANAPVFAAGATIVFKGAGCTFTQTVGASAVTFVRTGTFKLSSRTSWSGVATGAAPAGCSVSSWSVVFDNKVDVAGVPIPGSDNDASGSIALGAPVRNGAPSGSAAGWSWLNKPVIGQDNQPTPVKYRASAGVTSTQYPFFKFVCRNTSTGALSNLSGNGNPDTGTSPPTYTQVRISGSSTAGTRFCTYNLATTAAESSVLVYYEVRFAAGVAYSSPTDPVALFAGTNPTPGAVQPVTDTTDPGITSPVAPPEPADPNPNNEPATPSGGCDFGITDPTSWLCGLGGILERIYSAVVGLAGAIAGLVGDLLSGLGGLFVPSAETMTRLQNASGVPADAVPFSWFGDAADFVTGALDAQTQCFTLAPTVGPFGQITMLDTCTPAPVEGLIMGKRSLLSVALYVSVLAPLLWWAWKTYAPAATANG